MDRRHFMGIVGAATALFGTAQAEAAPFPAGGFGKSVLDWGVQPNADRDQSAALQKAIDELSSMGQPVFIPAGRYLVAKLQLPANAAVFGVPGLSVLNGPKGAPVFECVNKQDVSLRGLSFIGNGLAARECRNLTVSECRVISSDGDGLVCGGSGLLVSNNRAASCARSAIWVEGDGMVTNNFISGAGQFGLRLGALNRLGILSVNNNMIDGTAVGIAVSNADDGYALITMNMITGAKGGGIRALNGDELIGKDLTKGGSEAFRNLAIVVNVSI